MENLNFTIDLEKTASSLTCGAHGTFAEAGWIAFGWDKIKVGICFI